MTIGVGRIESWFGYDHYALSPNIVALDLSDNPDGNRTTRVHRELLEGSYVVGRRPGPSVLRLDPSLIVEREDVEAFLTALEPAGAG